MRRKFHKRDSASKVCHPGLSFCPRAPVASAGDRSVNAGFLSVGTPRIVKRTAYEPALFNFREKGLFGQARKSAGRRAKSLECNFTCRAGRLPPISQSSILLAALTSISISLIETSGSLPPSTSRPQSESFELAPPVRSDSRWHSMQ